MRGAHRCIDPPVRQLHANGIAEPWNIFARQDRNGAIAGNSPRHYRRPFDERAIIALAVVVKTHIARRSGDDRRQGALDLVDVAREVAETSPSRKTATVALHFLDVLGPLDVDQFAVIRPQKPRHCLSFLIIRNHHRFCTSYGRLIAATAMGFCHAAITASGFRLGGRK